ncbi:hypothetical protein ONE63_000100 [Megalurothrips usitatus]|uniref:AMP-binding enzyme C-terminal domain-containing protein n=1 Tax=Megalurothrips usitatus TaxID=439358 RepID=A0AAV7XXE9_9NEOP|nr:hypothetical protein ONE63_000100 [Megalurothrips usitatus]
MVDPDTGADIPESTRNVLGEVRVRSAYAMHGYVGNPEATAKAYDELGFYKTGDLVHQADDGHYYFADRITELLKYKRYSVFPAEVEMVLLQHPAVLEACVLGRWCAADGDVPTAFVVRAPTAAGAAVTERDLQALVAERLSDYKQLRGGVLFLEHMPKTLTGKVARRELKARLDAFGSSQPLADN